MHLPLSGLTILGSASLSAATGYFTSRVSQQRLNAYTYRSAIITEIRTLLIRLSEYEAAFTARVVVGESSGVYVLRVLLQSGDIAVYSNNTASIGLLGTGIALRVLRFYADFRTLQGHALILAEIASQTGSSASGADMQRHLQLVRRARQRARVLVRRGCAAGHRQNIWCSTDLT